MEKTLQRIEEALENNWAIEADDIRALVEAYKQKELAKIHWKQRCQLAEKYIKESQLQALKEEVDALYGDAMAHPKSSEGGWNAAIEKVLNLITNLEDNADNR